MSGLQDEMFTSHYESKFQVINALQFSVNMITFKLQNHGERELSEWVSWMYDTPHSIHISQRHYHLCFVLTLPFLSLRDSSHSQIKSAWAGLDVIIFYCSLYYRWYPLLVKVLIICCKIKILYNLYNNTVFSKVIILWGGHRECLFSFILK